MEGVNGDHNVFWEIMEMNLFNNYFNQKYQQKIKEFIKSSKFMIKIDNYCVKLNKVFEIYDSKNSQKPDLGDLKQRLSEMDG